MVAVASPTNGLNLTSGEKFGFHTAEVCSLRKAAAPMTVAGAPTLEHYREDGVAVDAVPWGLEVGVGLLKA